MHDAGGHELCGNLLASLSGCQCHVFGWCCCCCLYVHRNAESKLNNFTRLEPVYHLLGIPFDTNVARDVMAAKRSTVTRLLYQMYIALNNKKKSNLTSVAMETQRPAAPAKLQTLQSVAYANVRTLQSATRVVLSLFFLY